MADVLIINGANIPKHVIEGVIEGGHHVESTLEPESAIKKFKEKDFDLILISDIPSIINSDILALLSEHWPDSKYVLVIEKSLEKTISTTDNPKQFFTFRPDQVDSDQLISIITIARQMRELENNQKKYKEHQLYPLIDQLLMGVVIHQDGKLVYANKRAFEIIDLDINKPGDLSGRNVLDVVDPLDKDLVSERLNKEFRREKNVDRYEIRLINPKSGKRKWVQIFVSEIQYRQRPALIAHILDIADQKKAEKALKKSELRYRLLIENATDVIWIMDMEFNLKYISPSVERVFGFSIEGAIGHKPYEIFPSESLQKMAEFFRFDPDQADPFRTRNAEVQIFHKNGSLVWVEVMVTFVLDGDGNPVEMLGLTTDITERKMTEQRLLASEERYRLLSDNATDVIWTMNLDLQFTYISPSVFRLRGYTAEEAMAMPLEKTLTPESIELAVTTFQQEYTNIIEGRTDRVVTIELEQYCKDGSAIWTEATVTPLHTKHNELIGMLGVTRDITIQKQTRIALQESEKHYRLMAENSSDVIWVLNFDGTFDYISPSVEYLTGYSPDEVRKMSLSKFLDPKTAARIGTIMIKELQKSSEKRRNSGTMEIQQETKDGKILDLEITVTWVLNENGEPIGLQGSTRDISERKTALNALSESEQKYRSLVESSTLGIFILHDNRFVVANESLCDIFGVTMGELLVADPMIFFGEDSRETIEEAYRQWKNTGDLNSRFDLKIRKTDGVIRSILLNVREIEYKGERAIHGVITDVTKEKNLEEQLRQSQKMETIGTLAGGIAHDINNILQTIFGYTHVAMESLPQNESVQEDLKGIHKAAIRAKDLIRQILSFSRRMKHERAELELYIIIKESLKMLRATLSSTIEIRHQIDEKSGTVLADPSQIHQVILNLCTNASHAMDQDVGILEVTLDKADLTEPLSFPLGELDPGRYTHLQVKDNGRGMSTEVLSKIFEPFYTTKQIGEGTGLGLSVVHGIVQDHGGHLFVDSKPGQGTVFDLYLPRVEKSAMAVDDNEPSNIGGNESILLVDDEKDEAG